MFFALVGNPIFFSLALISGGVIPFTSSRSSGLLLVSGVFRFWSHNARFSLIVVDQYSSSCFVYFLGVLRNSSTFSTLLLPSNTSLAASHLIDLLKCILLQSSLFFSTPKVEVRKSFFYKIFHSWQKNIQVVNLTYIFIGTYIIYFHWFYSTLATEFIYPIMFSHKVWYMVHHHMHVWCYLVQGISMALSPKWCKQLDSSFCLGV